MKIKLALITALVALICISCSKKETEPLLFIDDKTIELQEAEYLITAANEQLALGLGEIDWSKTIDGQTAEQYVKKLAIDIALSSFAIDKKATELGYTITEQEKSMIDQGIQGQIENAGGESAFQTLIEKKHSNMEIFRFYNYTVPLLNEKLSNHYFSQDGELYPTTAQVAEYYNEKYTNVAYLFISASDSDGLPLTGMNWETQLAVAKSLHREILNGGDFMQIVAEHGQDYYMSLSPEGIPVQKGMYDVEFDNEVQRLSTNELSDVVVCQAGFYIIKKLPENLKYLEENYSSVLESYLSDGFIKLLEEWISEITYTTTYEYDAIDPKLYFLAG